MYPQLINRIHYPVFIGLVNRSVNDIPDTRNAKNMDGSIDYSKIDYFLEYLRSKLHVATQDLEDEIFSFLMDNVDKYKPTLAGLDFLSKTELRRLYFCSRL